MAIIYINPMAASNGTGASLADPKNTYVGLTTAAGDYIAQVAGTTYYAGAEVVPSASGTAKSPITFCTCDATTGELILDGSQRATIKALPGVAAAMNIGSRIHIHVRSLNLYGQEDVTASTYGLNMRAASESGASYNQVWYCTVQHPGGTGIGARGRYLKIMHTEISRCWTDGIFATVRDFEVGYCYIYDVDRRPDGLGDCIDIDGSIADLGTTRIHHNRLILERSTNVKQCLLVKAVLGSLYCEDNYMFGGGGASLFSNVPLTIVARNMIVQPYATAMSFGGAGSIHQVEANVIKECDNVFVFNENSTVLVGQGNSILHARKRILSGSPGVTGLNVTWKNNVCFKTGTGEETDRLYTFGPSNTFTSNENAYFGTLPSISWDGSLYNTLSDFTTATSQDSTTLTGIDSLTNLSGIPLAGSPLRAAATFTRYSRDFTGKQRPNPPSIGAYEFVSSRGIR